MHGWLVRAAVVGGDHVGEQFSAGLEQAIGYLAETTWKRLGVLRERLAEAREAREAWQARLEDWERERQQEEAHPSLGSELWKRRFPAHRERFERMDRNVAERGGLEDAVQAWQEPVEGEGWVEELDNQNHEVKIALLHLTGAVAGEMARQSGATRGSE